MNHPSTLRRPRGRGKCITPRCRNEAVRLDATNPLAQGCAHDWHCAGCALAGKEPQLSRQHPELLLRSAIETTIDKLHEQTMGHIRRIEAAVANVANKVVSPEQLKLRGELLATTKKLAAAERKLADVDELAREMASALRQSKLTKLPVKPWQFENCAKRLRAILDSKGRR